MLLHVVVFKQKTAYEMRISDWSSDVCSSDLFRVALPVDNSELAASSDPKKQKKNTVSWSFAPPARDLQPHRIASAILPPSIPMMDLPCRYAFCLISNVLTQRPTRNDHSNAHQPNLFSWNTKREGRCTNYKKD